MHAKLESSKLERNRKEEKRSAGWVIFYSNENNKWHIVIKKDNDFWIF